MQPFLCKNLLLTSDYDSLSFLSKSDDCQELLQADFEIGQLFREHVIPRAALIFTGEAMDDHYIDYEESDWEDEDDDEVSLIKEEIHSSYILFKEIIGTFCSSIHFNCREKHVIMVQRNRDKHTVIAYSFVSAI